MKLEWLGEQLATRVDNKCRIAVEEGAKQVLADAKRGCPEKTGELEATGEIVSFKRKYAVGSYVKFGSKEAYYAPFVELGTPGTTFQTKGMKDKERKPVDAKPFMRPALRKNKARIRKGFDDNSI